ncbi:Peptidase S10, serine carboxypeptidase [Sesbania bispinosa]|nr:Peptidase S10, serine carboxypeptidase [Sesbania bispinosa]
MQISSQLQTSRSKVEILPGFQGPLPFQLETGYVGLGENNDDDDMQVFYYFIKSENNPEKDPLMLWLTGGPLAFEIKEYDGNLPNLILRPQSWTKVCSIIFVDLPLGTGFSYAKNLLAQRSDWKLVHHAHQFLRKWLIDHPEFLSNDLYIGADSYSGIPAPAIVQEISNGNEKGLQPWINLQGYLLGNPITTYREKNHQIPCAHGMGLISDELYECLSGINMFNILDRFCEDDSKLLRRSLTQELKVSLSPHLTVPELSCQGTIGEWKRCYTTDFKYEIPSSFEFHVNLSAKGYRSLIYSGDHDLVVPFMSTQAWIRALNYSIVEDWRPWLVDGQVAGYTRTYSNRMTFATVKGSGHTAPEYKPDEGFAMFTRWISSKPL